MSILEQYTLIDLTHPLSADAPTWNGSCGFFLEIKKDYDRIFRVQQIKMHAGVGTHMDAPSHRFEGGLSISEIPLEQCFAKACVIDVSDKAEADFELSVADVEQYEKSYGHIPKDALVIVHTGWSRFWLDPDQYRNVDKHGQMHFPAISEKAAEVLLQKDVVGVAIDTLSPDCLDQSYPVHRLFLGAGKYIIENVANASQMPPHGSFVLAFPINAENATESPIRMVGLIET